MNRIRYLFLVILIISILILTGCKKVKNETLSNQVMDFDMIISAQEGRIEKLENQNKRLVKMVDELNSKIDTLEEKLNLGISQDTNNKDTNNKDDRYSQQIFDLHRLLFKQLQNPVDLEWLNSIIENNQNIYKSKMNLNESYYLFWIANDNKVGDAYIVDTKKSTLAFVGTIENLYNVNFSFDEKYAIIECRVDENIDNNNKWVNDYKAKVFDLNAYKIIYEFEYTGEPLWTSRANKIVYISNISIQKDSSENSEIKNSVYLYDLQGEKEVVLDAGDKSYYCSGLTIGDDGKIMYTKVYKDKKKEFIVIEVD